MRTFKFRRLRFEEKCHNVSDLTYNDEGISYKLDINKEMPKRDALAIKIEEELIKYNQEADHCTEVSPVVKGGGTFLNI